MAKNSVRDYSATNADNTDIQSIDISEGCSPAGINNAVREVMVDLKNVSTGAVALESPAFDSASLTGDLTFGDNDKAIFGADGELEIFSNGTTAIISETGGGDLYIKGASTRLLNPAADKAYFVGNDAGASTVFYNGQAKLATTATGVDVTGTVTADGLTVDKSSGSLIDLNATASGTPTNYITFSDTGGATAYVGFDSGSNDNFTVYNATATGDITFRTNATERLRILAGGGITFNGDTAAANALDDYEEGTFTVTMTPNTSGSITQNASYVTLSYTKIGRAVTITGNLVTSGISSAVGSYVNIGSLPFANGLGTQNSQAAGTCFAYNEGGGVWSEAKVRLTEGSSTIEWYVDASTLTGTKELYINLTYFTD